MLLICAVKIRTVAVEWDIDLFSNSRVSNFGRLATSLINFAKKGRICPALIQDVWMRMDVLPNLQLTWTDAWRVQKTICIDSEINNHTSTTASVRATKGLLE